MNKPLHYVEPSMGKRVLNHSITCWLYLSELLKSLLFFFILLSGGVANAQQDPLYGLYLNNPMTINPAYTGITDNMAIFSSHRQQWSGLYGAPKTIAAGGHLSIRENKMGAGLLIVQDQLGENKNTNISTSYAYKLDLYEKVLSFGMSAGIINYKTDISDLSIHDPDPLFTSYGETKFNLGAGIALKSERYFIGLSVPRLMNNSSFIGGKEMQVYQRHFYAMGSYMFFVSQREKLKPSLLLKTVKGSPLSVDMSLTIIRNEKFGVGLFARNLTSFGLLANFNFLEKYRLAYSYEIPGSKSVDSRFATHEILIIFRTAILDFHDHSQSNF